MIFGKAYLNITIYSDNYQTVYGELEYSLTDETTAFELFANYFLGLIMIASFLISSTTNPLLLWINWKQDKKWRLSTVLFMLLAISDFLTNMVKPLRIANNLLTNEIFPIIRNGTLFEQVETVFFLSASFSSLFLTTLISLCRFISVKFPFIKMPSKLLMGIFVLFELSYLAYSLEMVVGLPPGEAEDRMKSGKVLWFLHCQLIFSKEEAGYGSNWFYLKTALPATITLTGVFLSSWTVLQLLKRKVINNRESEKKRIRSAYAVTVMNIANIITTVVIIFYQYYQSARPVVNFLGACGCFIICSAANPLIRICFSSEIKEEMSCIAKDSIEYLLGLLKKISD